MSEIVGAPQWVFGDDAGSVFDVMLQLIAEHDAREQQPSEPAA